MPHPRQRVELTHSPCCHGYERWQHTMEQWQPACTPVTLRLFQLRSTVIGSHTASLLCTIENGRECNKRHSSNAFRWPLLYSKPVSASQIFGNDAFNGSEVYISVHLVLEPIHFPVVLHAHYRHISIVTPPYYFQGLSAPAVIICTSI